MSSVELNILLFISSCVCPSFVSQFDRILSELKKATNNTQGRRRQRRRQIMTTHSLLVSSSSAATAVFKTGGGKNNNSNARRPRNHQHELSRHLSPTQRKTSTRAASLPPSRFNFTSSNNNNNESSSSSSYPNGNSHRLSAMEEEGFAGKSAFFEEALSEQERTRSRMFNTEPLSMVTPSTRQESNGSASTSSFTSKSNNNSSNNNNNEIVGTFFKHEPREKWKKKNKFPVLFYSKEHEPLAKKIAELEEFSVELGTINWESFNDGFPDLFINDAYDIRDRHVAFLASFHNPEVIFEQLSIIFSLPKMFVASFTLVLPFFPTGTAERVAVEGEVATAVTLARMLSSTPPSRGGPTSAVIFDIHALQERFYFGDAILPCFESGIPMLLKRLQKLEDAQNVVIAYPDEGAYKRFHSFFDRAGYESVVCTKVRQKEKRIVKLKEGEPAGRHCVIVDDLVQSGGTLIECQALLQKLGATKVSAYVTHGVFPNKSWKRFTSEGAGGQGFSNFWITDSCPMTVKDVEGLKPFEVLSLARRIAKALQI